MFTFRDTCVFLLHLSQGEIFLSILGKILLPKQTTNWQARFLPDPFLLPSQSVRTRIVVTGATRSFELECLLIVIEFR